MREAIERIVRLLYESTSLYGDEWDIAEDIITRILQQELQQPLQDADNEIVMLREELEALSREYELFVDRDRLRKALSVAEGLRRIHSWGVPPV